MNFFVDMTHVKYISAHEMEQIMTTSHHGQVEHINPESLSKDPAFANVIVVTGQVKTIYIGGQDASGRITGKGNIYRRLASWTP